jgi:Flp pilus assembly protein TadD
MSAAVRDSAGWGSSGTARPASLNIRAWPALGLALLVVQLVVSIAMWRQATSRQLPGDAPDDAVLMVRLAQQPIDVAGHLALGIARLNADDPSGARRALRAAAAIAPNEPQVLRTQAFVHFALGETAPGVDAVVRLLDAEPESAREAYAVLGNVMSTSVMEAVVNRWAEERSAHLGGLADAVCTSNQALQVKLWLATRAAAAAALRPETLNCLFSQAARSPDVASVYALWLGGLPPTQSGIDHVWNGNFEQRERATPFDWKLGRGGEFRDGYSVTIQLERGGGPVNRYLSVELNGRPIASTIAETNIVLAPGDYTLAYRTRDLTAAGNVRVGLSIACHGTGQMLVPVVSTSSQTAGQVWSTIRERFVVPSACHAQVIRVDGSSPSWKAAGIKGRVDFDDVVISTP